MKNLTIGARLGLGFAIVLVLLAAMSVTALTRMDQAGSKTHRLVNTSMKNQRNIAEWRRNIEVNSAINETVYHAPDAAILDVVAARRAAITARSNVLQKEIDAALANPGVREQFKTVQQERVAYMAACDALFDAKRAGDPALIDDIYRNRMVPQTRSYLAVVGKFADMQSAATSVIATTILDTYANTRIVLFTLAGTALLLGVACAWFITRSITQPLRSALAVAERVAAGDLTSRIEAGRRDEVGQLLDALGRMNTNLAGIVGQVRDGTATIAHVSADIAAATRTCRPGPSSKRAPSKKRRPRWKS